MRGIVFVLFIAIATTASADPAGEELAKQIQDNLKGTARASATQVCSTGKSRRLEVTTIVTGDHEEVTMAFDDGMTIKASADEGRTFYTTSNVFDDDQNARPINAPPDHKVGCRGSVLEVRDALTLFNRYRWEQGTSGGLAGFNTGDAPYMSVLLAARNIEGRQVVIGMDVHNSKGMLAKRFVYDRFARLNDGSVKPGQITITEPGVGGAKTVLELDWSDSTPIQTATVR